MNIINSFRGDYYFLSNMYPCEFKMNSRIFSSTEQFFQMMKCDRIEDMSKFIGLNAYDSKRVGRTVKLRSDWDKVRVSVMRTALYLKFKNPELKAKLKGTGNAELIEGNNHGDKFWGVCNGVGENMLGKLLMEVRDNI